MLGKRTRYHTDFIIRAKQGLLSEKELEIIPSSTLSDWRHRSFSGVVGLGEQYSDVQPEFMAEFIKVKGLVCAAKCLWEVYCCFSSVLENFKGKKKLFHQNRSLMVESICKMSSDIGVTPACRLMGITVSRFYRWSNEKICSLSTFQLCLKTHPRQLTREEQAAIKNCLAETSLQNKPRITAYYRMMKSGFAYMNPSTFFKYANAIFGSPQKMRKPVKKNGYRASAPFELLHMDTTILALQDGTRAAIHLIVDNYSRFILGWKISRTCSSALALSNLKEVCEKYDLYYKPVTLWCDDGSENHGDVNAFLLQPDVCIEKQIARLDINYSNSMSEAANKRLKYFHLFPKNPKSFYELENHLPLAVEDENNREHGSLF